MLINVTKAITTHDVKFVSYTGRYPNLCSGVLTLEINGKEYKFGHNYMNPNWKTEKNFPTFWHSGGSCGFSYDYSDEYTNYGEWEIDVDELPEELKPYAAEIDEVFNNNVPNGCCGGCL